MAKTDTAELGERQKQALALFKKTPKMTTAAIAKKLGISENGVYQHKRRLIAAGHLEAEEGARPSGGSRKASGNGAGAKAGVGQAVMEGTHFERVAAFTKAEVQTIEVELAEVEAEVEQAKATVTAGEERAEKLRKDREVLTGVESSLTTA